MIEQFYFITGKYACQTWMYLLDWIRIFCDMNETTELKLKTSSSTPSPTSPDNHCSLYNIKYCLKIN